MRLIGTRSKVRYGFWVPFPAIFELRQVLPDAPTALE